MNDEFIVMVCAPQSSQPNMAEGIPAESVSNVSAWRQATASWDRVDIVLELVAVEGMGRLVAEDSTVGAGHKRLAEAAELAVKL